MIVYVAGPIRPKGTQTLQGNLERAKGIALELWLGGFAVICPHANTDLPIELAAKEMDEAKWIEGDLELLRKCDAVVGDEQRDADRDRVCEGRRDPGVLLSVHAGEEEEVSWYYQVIKNQIQLICRNIHRSTRNAQSRQAKNPDRNNTLRRNWSNKT